MNMVKKRAYVVVCAFMADAPAELSHLDLQVRPVGGCGA